MSLIKRASPDTVIPIDLAVQQPYSLQTQSECI
jgi:hypothetical protein